MRVLFALALAACSFPRPADVPGNGDGGTTDGAPPGARLTSFKFLRAHNSKLPHDLVGTLSGSTIDITSFGIDTSSLVPTFETDGTEVDVGGSPQTNSVTGQSFASPVDYVVRSADVSATYHVTVHVRNLGNSIMVPATAMQRGIVAGDIDGDGIDDLVLALSSQVVVEHITVSNGALAFKPTAVPPGDLISFGAIGLADFDHDGRPDLVLASSSDQATYQIAIYKNMSMPGMMQLAIFPAELGGFGYAINGLATGDLDNDGKPDLAVIRPVAQDIAVALNDSSGGTFAIQTPLPIATHPSPLALAIARYSGKALPDVLVISGTAEAIDVFQNNTSPTATQVSLVPSTEVTPGGTPDQLALADFDGDGISDIAVATGANMLAVMSHTGGMPAMVPASGPTLSVAAADLDGDGIPDLVSGESGSTTGGQIEAFINDGHGNFQPVDPPISVTGQTQGLVMVTGDFNGDKLPDFASLFGTDVLIIPMITN